MEYAADITQKESVLDTVRQYGKQLLSFIKKRVDRSEDAEDILQDVWYQFTRVTHSAPVEETGAWLYRAARNRIIDNYRRKKEMPVDTMEADEDNDEAFSFLSPALLVSDEDDPETEDLRRLFWTELQTALEELPGEQREVFIATEMEGIPFRELAARSGEKVNTLISRKRYAVLHLRKKLAGLYEAITIQ